MLTSVICLLGIYPLISLRQGDQDDLASKTDLGKKDVAFDSLFQLWDDLVAIVSWTALRS